MRSGSLENDAADTQSLFSLILTADRTSIRFRA